MKGIIFFLSLIPAVGFSQIIPVSNADSLIIKNRVKTFASYYKDNSDKTRLILKEEYSSSGEKKSRYLLSIWDVVSYSTTSTYTYNDAGKIAEILSFQEVLNLFPRDQEYIESFGDMPVNERILFQYNENGQLAEKKIFIFHTDIIPEDSSSNQIITYKYENEKLSVEESTSKDVRVFNKNYKVSFYYDSAGNLINRVRNYGNEKKPMTRKTSFIYDEKGNAIEKIVNDPSAPHNNTHEKYDYDSAGNLINLYIFSEEEEEFELETTFQYDDHGNRISGERELKIEYFENGLIKSESWTDDKTNKENSFVSEYEYY